MYFGGAARKKALRVATQPVPMDTGASPVVSVMRGGNGAAMDRVVIAALMAMAARWWREAFRRFGSAAREEVATRLHRSCFLHRVEWRWTMDAGASPVVFDGEGRGGDVCGDGPSLLLGAAWRWGEVRCCHVGFVNGRHRRRQSWMLL